MNQMNVIRHDYSDKSNIKRLQNIIDTADEYRFLWRGNPSAVKETYKESRGKLELISFRPQNIPDESARYSIGLKENLKEFAFFIGGDYYDNSNLDKPYDATGMLKVIENTEKNYVFEILGEMHVNFKSKLLNVLRKYYERKIDLRKDEGIIKEILNKTE